MPGVTIGDDVTDSASLLWGVTVNSPNVPAATETICDGPCNSRYRKARAEYEAAMAAYDPLDANQSRPSAPEVYPVYGDPWCGRCKNDIHAKLSQLDDLACLLGALPPSINAVTDDKAGKVSGSHEPPSPSRRMDDLQELSQWLRNWESAFRGGDPKPQRGWLASERTTITAWLTENFSEHIVNPDLALDYGREIRKWYRELLQKASVGQVDKHVKKACPRCSLYTLWVRDGDDHVRCINEDCGRLMSREELAALDKAA